MSMGNNGSERKRVRFSRPVDQKHLGNTESSTPAQPQTLRGHYVGHRSFVSGENASRPGHEWHVLTFAADEPDIYDQSKFHQTDLMIDIDEDRRDGFLITLRRIADALGMEIEIENNMVVGFDEPDDKYRAPHSLSLSYEKGQSGRGTGTFLNLVTPAEQGAQTL